MVTAAYDAAAAANDGIDPELIDMSATATLDILASIAFYAVTMASIFMMINMIRGNFTGSPLGTDEPTAQSANRMALNLRGPSTTIRQLIAAGAGPDTELDLLYDDEEE